MQPLEELCRTTLLKLCYRCFPVSFAKFLRTPFSQNTSGRLLRKKIVTSTCNGVCLWYYSGNYNNDDGVMMVLVKSLTNESTLSLFSGQERKNLTCHKQDLYQRKTYVYSLLNEVKQQ